MKINYDAVQKLYDELDEQTRKSIEHVVAEIVAVKKRRGKIMVVTGSGPNIHEGVTTLISELMRLGVIDSVTTSSAVIAHEMAGALDRVKRVNAGDLGMDPESRFLPRGEIFEFTVLTEEDLVRLREEMVLDDDLLARGADAAGSEIIKAAGNMAYPMGLRTENISREIQTLAQVYGESFELVAGRGADTRTMIGAGAENGLPVLVTVPQLVGGGAVGLSVADSITVSERCARIAAMIDESDIIIESAVALTQEIHDGPFECYTGHGIWAHWNGLKTCSLRGKTLIRIDLDENLRKAKEAQQADRSIQAAIDKGLPKTKLTGIPFRMEMSAFARLEGSLPLVGDIGVIWPVIAWKTALALNLDLSFMSYPQQTESGREMRDWIVGNVKALDRDRMIARTRAAHTTGEDVK